MSVKATGKQYWRSLDDRVDSPKLRERTTAEFPFLKDYAGPSRRQMLKVMGASLGLAGMTGCRWPREHIHPYAHRPEGRTPGVPVYYATALERGGFAHPLLVRSYDGRPIKIEGNDQHPICRGRTDAAAQASLLDLYDPDRSTQPAVRQSQQWEDRTWTQISADAGAKLAAIRTQRGAGLLILSGATRSPTIAALRSRLKQELPAARWFEYEPLSRDAERVGTTIAFGAPMRSWIQFDAADVIASFDDDFLGVHPAAIPYTREFAARRARVDQDRTLSRLYVIENGFTVTGGKADERYAVRSSDIAIHLCQLGAELLKKGMKLPPAAGAAEQRLRGFDAGSVQPAYLASLADDLLAHRGKAVITVGWRQPAEAHALAALLNAGLEATGHTVFYFDEPDADRPTHLEAIAGFAEALRGPGEKLAIILDANPVYDAPAELDFAPLLAGATSIHFGPYRDETAQACTWHVNAAHPIESWHDCVAYDGTLTIAQPLIAPLYDGRTAAQMLSFCLGDGDASAYDLVRRTHESAAASGDFERWWRTALHDGFVPGSAAARRAPGIAQQNWQPALDRLATWTPAGADEFEVVFAADSKVHDGRYANNGWLQELPDPLTKLTWDNAAMLSTADAARLGVRTNDTVRIDVGERSITIPAYVLPGHARGSVTVALGYGRSAAGAVGDGVGVNAYALRASSAWHAAKATVRRAGGSRDLATTQDHHLIDSQVGREETLGRVPELVREGTLGEYKRDAKFAVSRAHVFPLTQLFADYDYSATPRWAMSIDLTRCTGCSACVVACQAENNVPVVGRGEVLVGCEMHWLRIDRYFTGDPDADQVRVVHQPMACQHCENAPCEQVCPVAATVHDEEGLNVMVYNRCIGTRYCLNNCPYKVRRFNWYWNHHGPRHPRSGGEWDQKKLTAIEMMGNNPDVTVRSRGVMEKCTFCLQRINAVKIHAKNERRAIRDGEISTACEQVCPAEAITFGDLNDPDSRVSRLFHHDRAYELLQHLNVRTRNRYLAGVWNPVREPEAPAGADPHHDGHGSGGTHGS